MALANSQQHDAVNHDAIKSFYNAYLEYLPLKFANKKSVNLFKFTTKLAEEVGEVCEAALAFDGNSKKKTKLASEGDTPRERLAEEVMDVMITCLNVAHAAKLDVDAMFMKSVAKLNGKINERRAKQQVS